MTKGFYVYTASYLLDTAAYLLNKSIDKKNGNHMSIEDALIAARKGENGQKIIFPVSAFRRANLVFDLLYTDPKTKRRVEFGKRYSETLNKHAIDAVKRNAAARVEALRKAADRAQSPVTAEDRAGMKRAVTTPTSMHQKRNKISDAV